MRKNRTQKVDLTTTIYTRLADNPGSCTAEYVPNEQFLTYLICY